MNDPASVGSAYLIVLGALGLYALGLRRRMQSRERTARAVLRRSRGGDDPAAER